MANKQSVKITSGNLKGRIVTFIDSDGLRPTSSRIRETLFNWLQGKVYNKTCLDLFAGSGVLGIEAISHGAKHTTFLEKNLKTSKIIQSNLDNLGINQQNTKVINKSYESISSTAEKYDIIFIDPPYQLELLVSALEIAEKLSPEYIYIEDNKPLDETVGKLKSYRILKYKKAGQVYYGLLGIK